MKLLKLLNDENITEKEVENFKHRRAVRVIAFDTDGKIALVHAKIRNYYTLPGGGVEEGETLEEGAIREVKEEAGCAVKITGEVGIVKEYLKAKELINETFCYVADVLGDKGKLNLLSYEIEEGMEVIWVDINEAIKLLESTSEISLYATPLQVKYTKTRDITFLKNINKK
jgi:8-oxo-dGTP pyrophosphatase MutT (NUDIX family)